MSHIPKIILPISLYPQKPFQDLIWWKNQSMSSLLLMRGLLEGVFFAYHHAVNHPHTIIILSWFSIPLVLKCAAKILKIGLQIKI